MRPLMVHPLESERKSVRRPARTPAFSASATRPRSRTSVSASPGWSAPSIRARIGSPAAQSRRNARFPFAVRATVRARASVGCVSRSTSPRCLQQDEHGPHGAGVGRHAAGEFPLGEGVPAPGEGGEEDELVGGDAVRRERRVRPAVEGQVRGPEGDRDVVSGGHRRVVRGRGGFVRLRTIEVGSSVRRRSGVC